MNTNIFSVIGDIIEVCSMLVAVASAISAATKTPSRVGLYGKIYAALEFLALNIGRAKDKTPDDELPSWAGK